MWAADIRMLPDLLVTTKAVAKWFVGWPFFELNTAPTYGTPLNV
jgi:hypothetical protein